MPELVAPVRFVIHCLAVCSSMAFTKCQCHRGINSMSPGPMMHSLYAASLTSGNLTWSTSQRSTKLSQMSHHSCMYKGIHYRMNIWHDEWILIDTNFKSAVTNLLLLILPSRGYNLLDSSGWYKRMYLYPTIMFLIKYVRVGNNVMNTKNLLLEQVGYGRGHYAVERLFHKDQTKHSQSLHCNRLGFHSSNT